MADDPETSTRMPWRLRVWPLAITGTAVTAALLVLLAVFVHSDITRVALPAIAGAVGTIGLAVVTVWLSITERAHQDQLRRADELARRREAEHQLEITKAREGAAKEREEQLELAAAVRQARRVAAFGGWEGPPVGGAPTVTLVNGSDYPIFEIALIGARGEELSGPASHREWPPEMRLEGESLHVAVLLPGERHVFRGAWKWRKGFVLEGSTLKEQRSSYTWTDDQGRAWLRDGSEPPKLLSRPWMWGSSGGTPSIGTKPPREVSEARRAPAEHRNDARRGTRRAPYRQLDASRGEAEGDRPMAGKAGPLGYVDRLTRKPAVATRLGTYCCSTARQAAAHRVASLIQTR